MLGAILKTSVSVVGSFAVAALIIWLNNLHQKQLRKDKRISFDPAAPRDGTNFLEVAGFTAIVLAAGGIVIFIVSKLK